MCGIVGILSRRASGLPYHATELFEKMLVFDSIRGEDSTGVFGVDADGNYDMIKGDADGYMFVRSDDYSKFSKRIYQSYKWIVGHNRKATKGTVTPQNAHPFIEQHIILVHNGTIHNADDLNNEVEVDSHAIAHALAADDPKTALGKINGAYALIWYDKSKKLLNIARNDQRPLHLLEYEDCYVVSSEMGLPIWLQGRNSRTHKSMKPIPTSKILQMSLTSLEAGFKEVDYDDYKAKSYSAWPKPGITEAAKTGNFTSPLPIIAPTSNQIPIKYKQKTHHSYPFPTGVAKEGFKEFDTIKFRLDDIKNDITRGATIFGCPYVSDTEIDGNIIVQAFAPKPVDMNYYMSTRNWEARITSIREVNNVTTLLVSGLMPCYDFLDAQGNQVKIKELPKDFTCGTCNKEMFASDIKDSIIKQREDKSWRLMCKECLSTALDQAKPHVGEDAHYVQ